jgi:hypothetical protein
VTEELDVVVVGNIVSDPELNLMCVAIAWRDIDA